MKRTLIWLITLSIVFSLLTVFAVADDTIVSANVTVIINANKVDFPIEPVIINNKTMVPLRKIFETLGLTVGWDGATRTITGIKGKKIVTLQLDNLNAKVEDKGVAKEITLEASPTSINGNTFVPVRFIAESVGAEVTWIGETRTVVIRDFSLPGCDSFDTDGDTLPDFYEIHKYFTNPDKKDSDDDGKDDNDWNERTEYTYVIKTNSSFLIPADTLDAENMIQDGRIISHEGDRVNVETVLYPYTTYDLNILENYNWQHDYENNKALQPYLQSTPQLNWDEQMRKDLLTELAKSNIYPEQLSDLELVEQVSSWLKSRQKYMYGYSMLWYTYKNGKVYLPNDAKAKYYDLIQNDSSFVDVKNYIEEEMRKGKSLEQLYSEMPLGKSLFYNKVVGECTSHAILWGTVMRALGIPSRVTVVLPILAQGNKSQQDLITNNIQNEDIKNSISNSFLSQDGAVGSHYFNEVFVGNKWIFVDGTGNLINKNYITAMSPMVQYASMIDVSDFEFYDNWFAMITGKTQALSPNGVPYRLNDIKDEYGVHIEESATWKSITNTVKTKENKHTYNRNVTIAPNDDLLAKIMKKMWAMDVSTYAWCSKEEIKNSYNAFIIFDDSTVGFSEDMKALFKQMQTKDTNYIHVKIVDDKLLVYIRTQNEEKMQEFIDTLNEDELYTEQYRAF